jgi:hypothetical protein
MCLSSLYQGFLVVGESLVPVPQGFPHLHPKACQQARGPLTGRCRPALLGSRAVDKAVDVIGVKFEPSRLGSRGGQVVSSRLRFPPMVMLLHWICYRQINKNFEAPEATCQSTVDTRD